MQGSLKTNKQWRIGVVISRFNSKITEKLAAGALERLSALGMTSDQIVSVKVPGALEIPMAAQWLLASGCDGVVALGAVIRGETSHYDYVCAGSERGCSELQIKFNKPIAFGVLTTENGEQALARTGGAKGHKGVEAAEVLIEMLNLKNGIQANQSPQKESINVR